MPLWASSWWENWPAVVCLSPCLLPWSFIRVRYSLQIKEYNCTSLYIIERWCCCVWWHYKQQQCWLASCLLSMAWYVWLDNTRAFIPLRLSIPTLDFSVFHSILEPSVSFPTAHLVCNTLCNVSAYWSHIGEKNKRLCVPFIYTYVHKLYIPTDIHTPDIYVQAPLPYYLPCHSLLVVC